jgi:hypothetical protein
MSSNITIETIPTHILRDNEIQVLKAQNRVYLDFLERKTLTEVLTKEEKEQFEHCKTVEKELDFVLNPNYKSTLVTILREIQDALQGKEFDALTIVLYNKKDSIIIENSDENFKTLIKEFNDGFYGIMHIELSEDLFNFFQRIRIKNDDKSKSIFNSIKEKSERKNQLQKEMVNQTHTKRKIESLSNTLLEKLENELTELLSNYLYLSSGITVRDQNGEEFEASLSQAFDHMEDTIETHRINLESEVFDSADNDVAADGHAVVAKNLFQIDSNNMFLIKNHWGEGWSLKGELFFEPKERVYYANVTIIRIRDRGSQSSNLESLGGRQSCRKTRHKKTYRKLQRKLKITKKPKRTKRTKKTKGYKRK